MPRHRPTALDIPKTTDPMAAVPTPAATASYMKQSSRPNTAYRNSAAWSTEDDRMLWEARGRGMNWQNISDEFFSGKTANACRKRYERLLDRNNAIDWSQERMERLASEYMPLRQELWMPLANKLGEKWQVVEMKCLELGLRALSSYARSHARRNGHAIIDEETDSSLFIPSSEPTSMTSIHPGKTSAPPSARPYVSIQPATTTTQTFHYTPAQAYSTPPLEPTYHSPAPSYMPQTFPPQPFLEQHQFSVQEQFVYETQEYAPEPNLRQQLPPLVPSSHPDFSRLAYTTAPSIASTLSTSHPTAYSCA